MSDLTRKLSPEEAEAYIKLRFPAENPAEPLPFEPAPFNPGDALKSPGDGPGIYMGFWGEYNSGSYWGNWIDLGEINSVDDLNACIKFLRELMPQLGHEHLREEWMIQSSQKIPAELSGENPDLKKLASFAETAQEIGSEDLDAYLKACDCLGYVLDESDFRDAFCGYWDSVEDYAMQLAEDCAGSREEAELTSRWPYNCIDWQQAGRELEIGGDIWTGFVDGKGLAIFRNI